MSISPLVNIWMITYNHEEFIEEAINGVLMQKTSFPFQLIIGEDCSKDNTWDICLEYARRFPEKIKVLPRPSKNLGVMRNLFKTLEACDADYIALCEGDDYWTDKNKLQKQVDFLIKNINYSFTAHRVYLKENDKVVEREKSSNFKQTINFKSVSQNWYLNTCSFLFRNNIQFKESLFLNLNVGDRFIALESLKKGDGYVFNDLMGVYRIHPGGITKKNKSILHGQRLILKNFEHYYQYLDFEHKRKFLYTYKYQKLLVSYLEFKKLQTLVIIAYYILFKLSGKKAKIGNLKTLFYSN